MRTRLSCRSLTLLAGAALAAGVVAAPVAAQAVGPDAPYTTVLNGQYTFVPLPDMAMIERSDHGYIYKAGQQDSRLFVKQVAGGLRFHDLGTAKWKSLPYGCKPQTVKTGVAAICSLPGGTSTSNPMLVEIWPRLGDDYVNATTLSAAFDLTVLGDAGRDVIRLGAGDDFVNGAFDNDVVNGGAGDDWIRTGTGNDRIGGGPGNDKLVGTDGADTIYGGFGSDSIYGGNGADRLYARDGGSDSISGAGGTDTAVVERTDRVRECERVSYGS